MPSLRRAAGGMRLHSAQTMQDLLALEDTAVACVKERERTDGGE